MNNKNEEYYSKSSNCRGNNDRFETVITYSNHRGEWEGEIIDHEAQSENSIIHTVSVKSISELLNRLKCA